MQRQSRLKREEKLRERRLARKARKEAKKIKATKTSTDLVVIPATETGSLEEKRIAEVKKAVQEARAAHAANPAVKTWLQARVMSSTSKEERKKLYEEEEMVVWRMCSTCQVYVLKQDLKHTEAGGDMCLDCAAATLLYLRNMYVPTPAISVGTTQEDEQETVIEWLAPDVIETLDNFVDIESDIHREALEALADETGVGEHVLEWIIFRMPASYLKSHAMMSDIQDEFDTMYQEFCEALWEEKAGDADPELLEFRGIEEEEEACELIKKCNLHNYWYDKKGCPDCAKEPEYKEHKRCACGRFVADGKTDDWCFFCIREGAPTKKIEPVSGFFFVQKTCISCEKEATFHRENDPSGRSWCTECAIGCADKTCELDSNHTDPDGFRFCHSHSRGVAGVISDKLMKERLGDYVEIERI